MGNELLSRLVWTLGLILAGFGLYYLITHLVLTRAANAAFPQETPGRPAILYFTTPDCAPCRTIQRPAIQKVKQELGEAFEVVEINAHEQPELARAWGVLSVPTTFVIGSNGKPLHVNHGITSAEKLIRQLHTILA
jgi:thiol-disulfide isomerase/thioredoxin